MSFARAEVKSARGYLQTGVGRELRSGLTLAAVMASRTLYVMRLLLLKPHTGSEAPGVVDGSLLRPTGHGASSTDGGSC